MVMEKKMYEEIDKATEALMISYLIEAYARLLQIRHSSNIEKEIDRELKVMEIKLKCMGIEYENLKDSFS